MCLREGSLQLTAFHSLERDALWLSGIAGGLGSAAWARCDEEVPFLLPQSLSVAAAPPHLERNPLKPSSGPSSRLCGKSL